MLSSLGPLVEPRLNNKLATQVKSQESGQDAPNSSRSKSDLPPADGVDSANKRSRTDGLWMIMEWDLECDIGNVRLVDYHDMIFPVNI